MSSKRIAFATATETLSGTCTLTSFPSRDLTDITLPSISVIVPRRRVVVWALTAFATSNPASSSAKDRLFIVPPVEDMQRFDNSDGGRVGAIQLMMVTILTLHS